MTTRCGLCDELGTPWQYIDSMDIYVCADCSYDTRIIRLIEEIRRLFFATGSGN